MRIHALLGAVGIGVVVTAFGLARPAAPRPGASPQPTYGHLVLQLEGTVQALAVTWITPKQSAFNPTRVASDFAVDLLDGTGVRLGSFPVDLSRFDRNPANIGKPTRVEGCEVIDSRIATLVNVPWSAELATLQLRHGDRVIGGVDAPRLVQLVEQGAVR